MSIYFDFKTINELTRENSRNQERIFTLDELAQYDGQNGNKAYVAIEDIVYDVSNLPDWQRGTNCNIAAGRDLTEQFISCQEMIPILNNAPRIGVLRQITNMDCEYDLNYSRAVGKSSTTAGTGTNTSNFTPDDWVRYITPIINYAMTQTNQGNTMDNNMYQRVAIMGVLVGLGKTPRAAIDQLQDWEDTGKLTLLKGTGMGKTGTQGTTGGMGTGIGAGTGSGGTGMTGGFGTTGGTTGGMGTSTGAGTGSGGTGMMGGFGTNGGTTGGMGTGTGAGTGSGGTGLMGGFGTNGGTTGGMGTGTGAGTGFGGTGMTGGFGTTGGTTGGMGTGTGAGTTGGTTGTTGSTRGESETNNRLIFD